MFTVALAGRGLVDGVLPSAKGSTRRTGGPINPPFATGWFVGRKLDNLAHSSPSSRRRGLISHSAEERRGGCARLRKQRARRIRGYMGRARVNANPPRAPPRPSARLGRPAHRIPRGTTVPLDRGDGRLPSRRVRGTTASLGAVARIATCVALAAAHYRGGGQERTRARGRRPPGRRCRSPPERADDARTSWVGRRGGTARWTADGGVRRRRARLVHESGTTARGSRPGSSRRGDGVVLRRRRAGRRRGVRPLRGLTWCSCGRDAL